MTVDLILMGFGNVGRRFVRLLAELEPRLRRDYDLETRVVSIATRRRGCVENRTGLDAPSLASDVERGATLGAPCRSTRSWLRDALTRHADAARDRRLVVVEVTTLDIRHGQPAIDHVRIALEGGAHVISANKGPTAFAHHSLDSIARRTGRRFRFESAVLDGVPLFNMARTALPGAAVTSFRGVVNSTTNYMLTAMERGESFDAALATMQRDGIAEADPSLDVDGWDAAAKTAALANVLLGARLTPLTIDREGVTSAAAARAREALAAGRRLKLVAAAERTEDGVRGSVQLTDLPADDLLAGLDGPQNALVLRTDVLGEIAIVQRGSGLTTTAYGLVSDLVSIIQEDRLRASPRSPTRALRGRSPSARGRR